MINIRFIQEVGIIKYIYRNSIRQFYKKIIKKPNIYTLRNGVKFLLPVWDHHSTEVFVTDGDIDWGSEELFLDFMNPNAAFFDVGAHIGYYAAYMSSRVDMVYAFEPDPRVLDTLKQNLSTIKNTKIIQVAVGAVGGNLRLSVAHSADVSHLVGDGDSVEGPTIDVAVITLDEFVDQHAIQVGAIKTDVEGWDFEVLRGAETLIRKQQPLVLSEIQISPKLVNFAESLNYSLFAFARVKPGRPAIFKEVNLSTSDFVKMIFLVPARLRSRFEARARSGKAFPALRR